jgi:hypothetical protein
MKRLAYIFLAVFAMSALSSCKDEVLYEPGPQVEGPQYYFSTGEASSVKINQNTKSVSVDVFRVETASAGTVTVGVADESGLISPSSTATASFNAGSNKATLTFPIDPSKFTFAKNYPVTYTLSTDTTPYGMSQVQVTYNYPTPVKSLGKGKSTESYLTGGEWTPEILQSELDPNEFHIKNFMGSKSATLVIHVVQPGETWGDKTWTKTDLVYYDDTWSGLTYADVGGGSADKINVDHPCGFKSTGADENNWVNNRVAIWQDNGLPAVVEIAPFYYMDGLGGWNKSAAPTITIIFPGYDPKDYAVEATYAGIFTDTEGAVFGEAEVTLGEDIEGGVAILIPGESEEDIEAAIETLQAGEDESIVAFEGSTVRVPLPEGAQTGKYTIVVGGVAEDEVQEVAVTSFYYQAGEVTLDWDWLVGEWNAQDTEGDPYKMTITKKDETTAIFTGIWGMEDEAVMEGTVDFEAKTVTFKGPICIGEIAGGKLYIANFNEETEEYDDGEFTATLTPGGITISGHGYYAVGGSYDGDLGTDTTKMTK